MSLLGFMSSGLIECAGHKHESNYKKMSFGSSKIYHAYACVRVRSLACHVKDVVCCAISVRRMQSSHSRKRIVPSGESPILGFLGLKKAMKICKVIIFS